jgi:hypothetical protein
MVICTDDPSARFLWINSVSTRDFYAFLQRTTMKHSLGPWVHMVADGTSLFRILSLIALSLN